MRAQAAREAARAEATVAQCLNGGLGWLGVECNPLQDAGEPFARRDSPPVRHADLKAGSRAKMSVLQEGPARATSAHDQADG